ncbi:hypothetical protein HDV00_004231 [Rhizophlyctis rosea]|nr:hypothetical protein HDV00_004231 [Rhizophlyctis rosea]
MGSLYGLELTILVYGEHPGTSFNVRLPSPAASMTDLREQIAKKVATRMAPLSEPVTFIKALQRAVSSDFELYRVEDTGIDNGKQVLRSNDRRLSYISSHDIQTLPPLTETFAVTEVPMKDRSPVLAWFPHCRAHHKDRVSDDPNKAPPAQRIDILIHMPNPVAIYMDAARIQEASTRLSRSNSKSSMQRSFISDDEDHHIPSITDSPQLTPLPTPPPSHTNDLYHEQPPFISHLAIRHAENSTADPRSRMYRAPSNGDLKRTPSQSNLKRNASNQSLASMHSHATSIRTNGSKRDGMLLSPSAIVHEVPAPVDEDMAAHAAVAPGTVPLKATMGFRPTSHEHIHVSPGDLLHIYKTHPGGWCYGINLSVQGGAVGMFPSICVGGVDDRDSGDWGPGKMDSGYGSGLPATMPSRQKRSSLRSQQSRSSGTTSPSPYSPNTYVSYERDTPVPMDTVLSPAYEPVPTVPSRPMTPASTRSARSATSTSSSRGLSSRIMNMFSGLGSKSSLNRDTQPEPEIMHISSPTPLIVAHTLPSMSLPSPTPIPVNPTTLTSPSKTSLGATSYHSTTHTDPTSRPRAGSNASRHTIAEEHDIGTKPDPPAELTIAAGDWNTFSLGRKSARSTATSSLYVPTEWDDGSNSRVNAWEGGGGAWEEDRTFVASSVSGIAPVGAQGVKMNRASQGTMKSGRSGEKRGYVGAYGPDLRIENVDPAKGRGCVAGKRKKVVIVVLCMVLVVVVAAVVAGVMVGKKNSGGGKEAENVTAGASTITRRDLLEPVTNRSPSTVGTFTGCNNCGPAHCGRAARECYTQSYTTLGDCCDSCQETDNVADRFVSVKAAVKKNE